MSAVTEAPRRQRMKETMPFRRLLLLPIALLTPLTAMAAEPLRVGVIGLDTSHATEFTAIINTPRPAGADYSCKVVAAYAKGSPDIASSVTKVPEYTAKMKEMGVEIVDTIEALLTKVDAVLLETNDGRPHLEQIRPCLAAKKPVFIDKPVAGSLKDVITIFQEAGAAGVPVFSSSALRYAKATQELRRGSMGRVLHAETVSPSPVEPTHPDLFWYGIHGIESLMTLMGPGVDQVKRGTTPEGKIQVDVTWRDGRTGTFREGQGYHANVQTEKGPAEAGAFDGYEPLVKEICAFLHSGKSPVAAAETLEIYLLMEAAEESKRRSGAPVKLSDIRAKAGLP